MSEQETIQQNAVYCPDCKKTYILAKEMPSMQAIISRNRKDSVLVFNNVIMKRCAAHEKILGKIGTYDDMKEEIKCYEEAGDALIRKFDGVRKLVISGLVKSKDELINTLKAYFFTPSELKGLSWLNERSDRK